DPRHPTYIVTEPRLGYRMVAAVAPWTVPDAPPSQSPSVASGAELSPSTATKAATPDLRARAYVAWAVGSMLLVLAVAFVLLRAVVNDDRRVPGVMASPPQTSIAVAPFLDLSEHMNQEEFADGMTEELINRLGKIPGFRVPSPTSSFAFKNKRLSVGDIATALDVAYVLDGSTRKSGDRLRVAVRLIRADTEVVVWSESYD